MDQVGDVLAGFAAAFTGESAGAGEIVHPERLDRARLDYSTASVRVVDEYLAHLHDNPPDSDEQKWARTVLGTGAYLSEVIRRDAARARARTFDDAAVEYPGPAVRANRNLAA
ncbi:hypothetical protein LX83_006692 [Goodfellowiella coeruleoviolacea]|uniref:Uncharacterized protein n=1 Tax=Goodfellowiella coeruleoviolacea TaxID=334858 RepID=A0AAE3KJ11_9PSEU|nr:hypothetical protein [Goodfellowiella coeruleoviolacea]